MIVVEDDGWLPVLMSTDPSHFAQSASGRLRSCNSSRGPKLRSGCGGEGKLLIRRPLSRLFARSAVGSSGLFFLTVPTNGYPPLQELVAKFIRGE